MCKGIRCEATEWTHGCKVRNLGKYCEEQGPGTGQLSGMQARYSLISFFLQASRYGVSPPQSGSAIRKKNLLFQNMIVIWEADDQNNLFKIINCQPTGQKSISEMEPGDFDLRRAWKITDLNCVPVSSRNVHLSKLLLIFGMVGQEVIFT